MEFHKWHPDQNSSGLIPPRSASDLVERSAAKINKELWGPAEPEKPTGPTPEEKKALALNEAITYLANCDADESKNLGCILMLRHGISRLDAESIVRKALELIAEGKIQNPANTTTP
jgi:hypothetical protein